jgi:protein O-mannosyl-transferase
VVLGLYNRVSRYPFVNFDDDRYVTENPHVRAGLTAETIKWAFTTSAESNWHPLTWLSHALDVQFFGMNAGGQHYINVLLHAVNAVLLFLILQSATGCPWRSFMVAAFFAVHPVNVESVAWVAERKNVLSMLFLLLALMAYQRYAKKPGIASSGVVMLLFACGLMAKPMVITLPFLLLLWDYWPLRRMNLGAAPAASNGSSRPLSSLIMEKIPLFALSAASAVITMKVQRAGGAMNLGTSFGMLTRLENAVVAYVRYLRIALWPAGLAPLYPHPGNSIPLWRVLLASLILISCTVTVFRARRQRYLLVGWLWFLGALVPVIGLVQVGGQAMADRYAYLPFVGLFILVCWGVPDLAAKLRISPTVQAVAAAAAVLVLLLAAYAQLANWRSSVALWIHTIDVTAPNFIAQDNLGSALVAEGRIDDAIPHFETAAKIYPDDPVAWLNIATHNQQTGKLQQAIEQFRSVLGMTSDPDLRIKAFENMGAAYRQNHDYPEALQSYREALAIHPDDPRALVGLGLVFLRSGDPVGAAASFTRAMEIQPTAVGYLLLQRALGQEGDAGKAEAAGQAADKLTDDMDSARKAAMSLLTN